MRQEKSRRKQSPTDFRWRKTAWRTKRESFITYQTQRDNEIPLIFKKYANQKRKREDLNKIGYENVRSFYLLFEKNAERKRKEKKKRERMSGLLTFDDEVVHRAGGAQRRPAGKAMERGSSSSNCNRIAIKTIERWRLASPWCRLILLPMSKRSDSSWMKRKW